MVKIKNGWFSFPLSLSSTFTFLTIFFSLKKKKIPSRKISAWLASCSSCHFLTWSWFLFSRLHLLPDIFDSHHFDFSFWENGICPETPTEVDVGKKFRCVVCTISYFVCWWERQNFLVKITFCCLFSSSLALKATYIASSPTRLIFKAQYKISSIHNFFANRKKWNDKYGKIKEIFLENKKSVNPINCGRVTGPGWCSWLILESLFMGGGSAGYSQSAIRVSSIAFSHFHFFLWVFHFHYFLFYFPL